MAKTKEIFNDLSVSDLKERIEAFRRELFSLRLNAATQHVKDYSQFRKLRKTIARGLTNLNQKEQQVSK